MSKKYGIFCESCNVLLNNEDNIFGTNLGQLYHSNCMGGINHGKSTDCKPQMLFKMNLKFADTPTLTTEAEREIMELKNSNNAARQSVQQLEAKIKTLEDALLVKDRLKDDVNKLMDYVVKLGKTLPIDVIDKAADIVNNTSQDQFNKQAYDENNLNGDRSSLSGEAEEDNIKYNISNNLSLLEARIKTLNDALLQTKLDGNKLTESIETVEKNKGLNNVLEVGNNITQDSNTNKQTHNVNNLSGEQHNQTENVAASVSERHDTCKMTEEKLEVVDLRRNCVMIQNPKRNCKSFDEASSYVRELGKEMNVQIADNSVIYIDMEDTPNLYVYFRDTNSKNRFLKNRLNLKYNPNNGNRLRILDYTDCGIIEITGFYSLFISLDTAFIDVLGLAKDMGMASIISSIDHIDVAPNRYNSTYSVRFNRQDIKNEFVRNSGILKTIEKKKSIKISDEGGHTSSCSNVHNFNMSSANVIGVAELMGLSLSTNDYKRIYVLNTKDFKSCDRDVHFSLVVEFSSNDIKNKFLKETSKLNRIKGLLDYEEIETYTIMNISDIETEGGGGGNTVAIKYYKNSNYMFIATSFIGLSKQLGFSFTPDQTDRFIKLSQFIYLASS